MSMMGNGCLMLDGTESVDDLVSAGLSQAAAEELIAFAIHLRSRAVCSCGHVHATVKQDGVTNVFHRCRARGCECNAFCADT